MIITIYQLPKEIVVNILEQLPFADLITCKLVNKDWQILISANNLEAKSYYRDFHQPEGFPLSRAITESYKALLEKWHINIGRDNLNKQLAIESILPAFNALVFFRMAKATSEAKKIEFNEIAMQEDFRAFYHPTFCANGTKRFAIAADNTARLSHVVKGEWHEYAKLEGAEFNSIYYKERYITGAYDADSKSWGIRDTHHQSNKPYEGESCVYHAAFSPDGSKLMTLTGKHELSIWNQQNASWFKVDTFIENSWIWHAAFSPDGSQIILSLADNKAKILSFIYDKLIVLRELPHRKLVLYSAYSPDGRFIVTASKDKTAKLWSTGSYIVVEVLCHDKSVEHVNFSKSGKYIVTSSEDRTAKIWKLDNNSVVLQQILIHPDFVKMAKFNLAGNQLITECCDSAARVWVIEHMKWQEKSIVKHGEYCLASADLSSSGLHMVTICLENNIKVWELKNILKDSLKEPYSVENTSPREASTKQLII